MKDIESVIKALPDNLLAKLKRIRGFLNGGRATVMVGAGFSKNADMESHVVMKDWNCLAEDIYEQLYAKKPTAKDLAFKTPMRLASLLASNVGRNALDQLIKDSLPDDLIRPGSLHNQLMRLNWRDVFTTNYDTLLERAAENSGRYYKVVTSKEMLLYKSSPRIIKLHGSFPDKTPFLMTEEDFRSYPTNHPEFVNTVRQALVESVFCLIGFSGDDPNFTSWQAWLKDVMGSYANPTYLITFDANYDDSFKKLMQARGVDVLNLAEVSNLKDYRTALDFFFSYLEQKEDNQWNAKVKYDTTTNDVKAIIEEMKKIRESYPGWFVLPKERYDDFRDMELYFPYLQDVVKNIPDITTKEKFLFELDWRADVSLTMKKYDWYVESIRECINSHSDGALSNEALSLAVSLLRIYRYFPDNNEDIEQLDNLLRSHLSDMTEEQKRRYYYTMSCNLLSLLQYDSLEKLLREWQPSKSDYDGIVYKALVIAEIHGNEEPSAMIGEALERISRMILKDTPSVEMLSRKAALEFLSSFYEGNKRPNQPPEYSFLALSDFFMGKTRLAESSERRTEHGFAIGDISNSWQILSGYNPHFIYPYRYLQLCEHFGFPYGMAEYTVDYKILAEIVENLSEFDTAYIFPIALRSGSRLVAETAVSRKVLVKIRRAQAERITQRLLDLLNKPSQSKALLFRKKNVLLPMLCRLATKISEQSKWSVFEGIRLYIDLYDDALYKDIHILYDSMLPETLSKVIDVMFSMPFDLNARGFDYPFPNIGYDLFVPQDIHLNIVIEGLESENDDIRNAALSRLEYILRSNITTDQRQMVEDAVVEWRRNYNNSRFYWQSFSLVPAIVDEVDEQKRQLESILDNILSKDYIFNRSSIIISELTDLFGKVIAVKEILSEKQKKGLLKKLAKIINDNKLAIAHDDSERIMGGLRKFVVGFFGQIGFLLEGVHYSEYDKDECTELFNALCQFVDDGLPVKMSLERLNNHCRAISRKQMRDIIEKTLFDGNKKTIVDSVNALMLHTENGGDVQTIYQKIIHYCATDITEQSDLYIQCLAYTKQSKFTVKTKTELGRMMDMLYERIPKSVIPIEYKVDLLHSCIALVRQVSKETSVSSIQNAVRLWMKYIEDPETFEDVKRAYYEKK